VRELTEQDAFEMHAVMATGSQPLHYMTKATSAAVSHFVSVREKFSADMLWTLDAGANPHFIFSSAAFAAMARFLEDLAQFPEFANKNLKVLFAPAAGRALEWGAGSKARDVILGRSASEDLKEFSIPQAVAAFRQRGQL
jgi:hypothetical protein